MVAAFNRPILMGIVGRVIFEINIAYLSLEKTLLEIMSNLRTTKTAI